MRPERHLRMLHWSRGIYCILAPFVHLPAMTNSMNDDCLLVVYDLI